MKKFNNWDFFWFGYMILMPSLASLYLIQLICFANKWMVLCPYHLFASSPITIVLLSQSRQGFGSANCLARLCNKSRVLPPVASRELHDDIRAFARTVLTFTQRLSLESLHFTCLMCFIQVFYISRWPLQEFGSPTSVVINAQNLSWWHPSIWKQWHESSLN